MEAYAERLTMTEIREIGRAHGVLSLEKFERKDDLIRTIQLAQGKTECFGLDLTCPKRRCQWRNECPADRLP